MEKQTENKFMDKGRGEGGWDGERSMEAYALACKTAPSKITALSWRRGLGNTMKPWAVPCSLDGQVRAESSEREGGSRGSGKPPQYTCHENLMYYIKDQKDMTLKDESPRSEGDQHASGEEWKRITSNSRMNEAAGPKRIWCSVVDVSGDESKIQCCKEQYCIGTWNVRSMNQGKLDVVK